MDIKEKIRNLIEPIINDNHYYLDDIRYEKEGNNYCLNIIIDKDGIIDVDDCVKVSNLINPILDKNDLIEKSYVLDVSSKERGHE